MSMFTRAHNRMNQILAERMNDGTGMFTSAAGESVNGLQLIVDSSFEVAGVLETLAGSIKAVSVHKQQLAGLSPVRGDMFEQCGKRYIVEDTLSDDHHFPTYACQEVS